MANYNSTHTGQEIDQAAGKALNPDTTPTVSSAALITSGGVAAAIAAEKTRAETAEANKVDKVAGKGLSTNDFTDADKTKLDGIESGAQVNTVTGVKGGAEESYRTGNVDITKANLGLGNVDNTADADKPVSTAQQAAIDAAADAVYPTDTVPNAAVASFPDGANNIPVVDLIAAITPVQSGTGDPAPDNVRPISGWTGCTVKNTIPTGTYSFASTQSGSGDPSPTNIRPIIPGLSFKRDDDTTLDVYGGSLDAATGVLTVTWHSIIASSLSTAWAQGDTSTTYRHNLIANNTGGFPKKYGLDNLICNSYKAGSTDDKGIYGATSTRFVYIVDSDYVNDLDGFNASLSNVQIVYELNIPYTIQLSKSEVIRALIALGVAEDVYTISWQTEAGTVYGGTLDVTTGVLTVTWHGILASSIDWAQGNTSTQYRKNFNLENTGGFSKKMGATNILCSAYKTGDVTSNDKAIYASNSTTLVTIRDDDYVNNPSGFIASLSDTQVVYELANPIIYQLTPTEVKTLLGDNNIFCDTGNVSVNYRADIALYIQKKIAEGT